MNQTTITIVAALLSGIIATIITLFWQNRAKKIDSRREIFNTLMAYRFEIANKESVIALNCVPAIFYDCPKVQDTWRTFLDIASKTPFIPQELTDAHIQLLEEIAKALRHRNIKWKDIKRNYFPNGLISELDDERNLRKAQLKVALRNMEESGAQAIPININNSVLTIAEK